MDALFLSKAMERETYANPGSRKPVTLFEYIQMVLSMTISIYAAYLAWNAGSSDSAFFRILITLLAFMFSTFYLIGYLLFKGFKKL